MKIFLSSLENGSLKAGGKSTEVAYLLAERAVPFKWNLISYYYARGKMAVSEFIRDRSEELEVDSGAHSIQHGLRVNPYEYTEQYCDFIRHFDRGNVIGYFEMDIDVIAGYDTVLDLRRRMLAVTDKVIPVWHKNRGIEEYKRMCDEFAGRIIAIPGFNNTEIKEEQYVNFLAYAKRRGCKVHCLGNTRKRVLDKVPFDYVDSSSWKQQSIYGQISGTSRRAARDASNAEIQVYNYKEWVALQEHYHQRWKKVCGD